ncbi:MAG: hypothetical protein AAF738_10435, partial [Bacteroidota bacterium]
MIQFKNHIWLPMLLLIAHVMHSEVLLAQAILHKTSSLTNASFEGDPQDATVPVGWFPCVARTTPDILPGFWGVYNEASEGETYIGLITRNNGTWEAIGQRFSVPLQPKNCYIFSIDLAHSKTYAGYNKPLKLRIWGGAERCGQHQLIAETDLVKHRDWETYRFKVFPEKAINYILLEAFYKEGSFQRNGNILIDNISTFTLCPRV